MSSNVFNIRLEIQPQMRHQPHIAHCIIFRAHLLSLEEYVRDHRLITSYNGGFIGVNGAGALSRRSHHPMESSTKG